MTGKRVLAVAGIFLAGALAWAILGSANALRSMDMTSSLDAAVRTLWGSPIVQPGPRFQVKIPGSRRMRELVAAATTVTADIELEQRRKGLLWYPTYTVDFSGTYKVRNETAVTQNIRFYFSFPAKEATYENVIMLVDGRYQEVEINTKEGIRRIIALAPGGERTITIRYRTRGLREWRYLLAPETGRTKSLSVKLTTNFGQVDFPETALSPMRIEDTDIGKRMTWESRDLVTRQFIGLIMPEKLNPGPLAARMSFFAPVCLLFFFVLISAICILRQIDIHPMHYLFVNAGFFAFHLLFAYLVDLIDVHLAFALAALVSVVMVVSYMRVALGNRFPWRIAALGQLFYLVVFSYSFFIKGMTGLTVTIASVITLAILMWFTARLNWTEVFNTQKTPVTG